MLGLVICTFLQEFPSKMYCTYTWYMYDLQWLSNSDLDLSSFVLFQDDDEEQRLWRDLCLDRMVRAVESSLVVLIILTSPAMPKQLYLEEVINRVIALTKFQLKNNIFPEYDPIYRESDPNGEILCNTVQCALQHPLATSIMSKSNSKPSVNVTMTTSLWVKPLIPVTLTA